MVTSPSPGTIRMRFALVDAKIPNSTENTVATYTPYVSTAHSLASLAFNGVGYFAGTATAEGDATDATNGGVLWEAVNGRGGTTALVENTLNNWTTSIMLSRRGHSSSLHGCKKSAPAERK
jgi:hypothetical protein